MDINKKPKLTTLYSLSLLSSIEIVYPKIEVFMDYKANVILIIDNVDDITLGHHGMDKNLK